MKVMVPDYMADDLLPKLREADPGVELISVHADGRYEGDAADAEVLFKFHPSGRFGVTFGPAEWSALLRKTPNLRWVHSGSAGVENVLVPELVESDVILTNGAGGPKRAIAETVLAFVLADAKALYRHHDHQKAREWRHLPHRELPGLTVAILGLGKTGLEIAKLCKSLGMRVIGTKRSVSSDGLPDVDDIFPASRQNDCVRVADYVVIAAALTPETQGMINAATFRAMKSDAIVINIARGAVVNEGDLIEALATNQIRGACLDVFATEPLPPESRLFDLVNVVIMPHNSPASQNLFEHMAAIFVENFALYCAGKPLRNIVNKRTGY
jgi:phosphoglycerate dehydrogenase-like enzyme